jgi:hypothetical protein
MSGIGRAKRHCGKMPDVRPIIFGSRRRSDRIAGSDVATSMPLSSSISRKRVRDFEELNRVFADALNEEPDGASALRRALKAFVDYGLAHPSRYRLLFSDPDLQADDDFKEAATGPFKIIVQIVSRCQSGRVLPTGDPVRLNGLIFAAAHGAIDLEIGGRASDKKGLRSVMGTMNLLLKLMAP